MSDCEYLLNPCFNPLQEMDFIQILSELTNLHDTLKESQKLFGTTKILVPKDVVIPTVLEFGSIILLSTPKCEILSW